MDAAVLTAVVVSQQEIPAIRPEHPSRNHDVAQQSDDDHAVAEAALGQLVNHHCLDGIVQEGDPLFGQEHHQAATADDI